MKRGHQISVCIDWLIMFFLAFIWLCLALKKHWIPLALFVPLMVVVVFAALAVACKLYNLFLE